MKEWDDYEEDQPNPDYVRAPRRKFRNTLPRRRLTMTKTQYRKWLRANRIAVLCAMYARFNRDEHSGAPKIFPNWHQDACNWQRLSALYSREARSYVEAATVKKATTMAKVRGRGTFASIFKLTAQQREAYTNDLEDAMTAAQQIGD
jgi:hypothetical protein